MPALDYRTSGGWISTGGLYSAPAAPGIYRVTVQPQGGVVVDTATVIVQEGARPNPTPWLVEDFGGYWSMEDLWADPKRIYSRGSGDDVNRAQMSYDPTDAPPGGGGSLVYNFPDRTDDVTLCHDYTIARNLQFPRPVPEVWIEVWTKVDRNFETLVPGGRCSSASTNAYKFIFARCHGSRCGRFETELGSSLGHAQTIFGPGLVAPRAWQVIPIPTGVLPYSQVADQQWHRWRFHFKVGPSGRVVMGFDDRKLYDSATDPAQAHPTSIEATDIYGLALGRNMNQGPTHPQSLRWGLVEVFRTDPAWGW
jgi:hypothetical protein